MPIERAEGVTVAEKYLKRLCERSFLSMWSYPGVFRDQGQKNGGDGKEVCDLLVVFDNDILIFSDKQCEFPRTGNLEVDWGRWFRKAILDSAKQIRGAERWIKTHPGRLFLDRACTQKFPVTLPPLDKAQFHRIVVAHDVSTRCREELGGSGSLILSFDIVGKMHYDASAGTVLPFNIGRIDAEEGFIHVFDDTSLDITMRMLDTVNDFVSYLKKKESAISAGNLIGAAGEEELLARYLVNLNSQGEHDFLLPEGARVFMGEGFWRDFEGHPQRLAQVKANRISYSWDALIEEFSRHALGGTQYYSTHPGIEGAEPCLRLMAREGRTRRRLLAEALVGLIEKTRGPVRATRVIKPSSPGDPYYIFLLMPRFPSVPYEQYREVRQGMLEACCLITKLVFIDAEDIVGIATETEPGDFHSEDAIYLNAREWGPEQQAEAKRLQAELGLLVNLTQTEDVVHEYPRPIADMPNDTVQIAVGKNPRNKPCPCGSGLKYKKCHGK